MALRFIDGFDHLTTLAQYLYKYNEASSASYIAPDIGRRSGSNAVRLYSTSGYLTKTLDEQATWIVGAAFKMAAMPSGNAAIFQFRDNTGNAQASLCVTSGGSLSLLRGTTSGTVLATSAGALVAGAWNFIEGRLTIADSGGLFEVRVNGEVWATYTGDTKYSSTLATANSIRISGFPSAVQVWYDDLYICDGTGAVNNGYLGDVRVDTLFPSGVGASAQFTPTGSATNWENVDDAAPDDDTSYNASETAGQIDSFTFADLTALNAAIMGVQANILARKDDAGNRQMRAVARVGSTNYEGADLTLTDSYLDHRTIWNQNPATAAAWTEAEINAAEFGYKVQA
ncbi:MAG: hypothetical protein EOM37_05340 [Proteobacteria bacterium]|nr:hypothetical protein [Pseudomonadota bacterium]